MTGTDALIVMALIVGCIFAVGVGMRQIGRALDEDNGDSE